MRGKRVAVVAALVVIAAGLVVGTPVGGAGATASTPRVTQVVLQAPTAYTPKAPPGGGTDDYHCTLLNPHLKKNAFITSIDFQPNSLEVHHEITYAVPPDLAVEAEAQNDGGKGWTCFGESGLSGSSSIRSLNGGTPWLTAWGPGHNISKEPAGTGAPMPAGSLVIVQEHYNLLVGDKPVRSKLTLDTVPATTTLRPLRLDLAAAPPDVPCPPGATGVDVQPNGRAGKRGSALRGRHRRDWSTGSRQSADTTQVTRRLVTPPPAPGQSGARGTLWSWLRTCTCWAWA